MTADDPRPAGEACVICEHAPRFHGPVQDSACALCSCRPAASGGATDRERDVPNRWRMTQACRDACHDQCARTDGQCTCTCHSNPVASQADGELRERVEALAEKWRGWQENSRRYGAAHPDESDAALARELAYGRAIEDLRRALDGD